MFSYLLALPQDVLLVLLSRIPPRSLLALSVTCKSLHLELRGEAVWRGSYLNRFFWDGASRDLAGKEEVKVLIQGCVGREETGWKKEALHRERMLE